MHMGRKRIDESEKKVSFTINLKKKVYQKIELEGKPKHVIEKMINEKYDGKDLHILVFLYHKEHKF